MVDGRIGRNDLEASFRDLQESVIGTAQSRPRSLVSLVGSTAVILILLAYLVGRRRGRRRSGFIEIRR